MIIFFLLLLWGISVKTSNDQLELKDTVGIKGAFAFLIVLGHINMYCSFGSWLFPFRPLNNALVLINGGFLALSGYGLFVSWRNKPNYLCVINLTKRIVHIWLPVGLLFIGYAVQEFLKFLAGESIETHGSFLSTFFYSNSQFWFIIELTVLYILFWVIFRICSQRVAMGCLILALLCWECIAIISGRGVVWYVSTLCFPMGLLIGKYKSEIVTHSRTLLFSSVGLFLIAFWLFCMTDNKLSWFAAIIGNISTLGFGYVMFWILYHFKVGNPVIGALGKISFEIYVVHMFVLNCLYRIFGDCIVTVLGTIVFTVLLGTVMHWIDKMISDNLGTRLKTL